MVCLQDASIMMTVGGGGLTGMATILRMEICSWSQKNEIVQQLVNLLANTLGDYNLGTIWETLNDFFAECSLNVHLIIATSAIRHQQVYK